MTWVSKGATLAIYLLDSVIAISSGVFSEVGEMHSYILT